MNVAPNQKFNKFQVMKQDLKINKTFDKNEWKIYTVDEKWNHEWKKTNTFLICLSNTNKKYKAYISFENSSL